MKLLNLFLLIFIFAYGSFLVHASDACDSKVVLDTLLDRGGAYDQWRRGFIDHWTTDIKFATTNGVEIEGAFDPDKLNVKKLAGLYVDWLRVHPSEVITDVKIFERSRDYYEISFLFKGNLKFFEIKKENFEELDTYLKKGIEMSSFILKDEDDIRLFSEMQEKFYKFGVEEESRIGGIHNHLGLKDLIDKPVRNPKDKRIISLYQNFKKIEQGLYDYFSTHPYRNASSGQTNSVDSVIGKNQSIRIAKGPLDNEYRTIELRLFNGISDPKYLAQALEFNNRFLSQYFDEASGLKKWMDSQSEISSDTLFKKLDLEYRPTNLDYPIIEGKISDYELQLSIFGTNTKKALAFLENSLAQDIHVEEFRKNLFAQLNLYLIYLIDTKKYQPDHLFTELKNFLDASKKIYQDNNFYLDIEEFVSNPNFREVPKKMQENVVKYFYPQGVQQASPKDIDAFFRGDVAENFGFMPFSNEDLAYLYQQAKDRSRVDGAFSILQFQLKNEGKLLSDYILSKKEAGQGFDRKVLEYILRYRRDMNLNAYVHLQGLLNTK